MPKQSKQKTYIELEELKKHRATLGLTLGDTTEAKVHKAFREQARGGAHPDKGGEPRKMHDLTEAREKVMASLLPAKNTSVKNAKPILAEGLLKKAEET